MNNLVELWQQDVLKALHNLEGIMLDKFWIPEM